MHNSNLTNANKDDMTYFKVQGSINRWPCVHQDYLDVQLYLGRNSWSYQNIIFNSATCSSPTWGLKYLTLWYFIFINKKTMLEIDFILTINVLNIKSRWRISTPPSIFKHFLFRSDTVIFKNEKTILLNIQVCTKLKSPNAP